MRLRNAIVGLSCAVVVAVASDAVQADESAGLSVGAPNDGALLDGRRLRETRYLRIFPAYAGRHADWGLGALVDLLDAAAREVRRGWPGSVTFVGDLSYRGGRDIGRHHSHESGRDADVGFFLSDVSGRAVTAGGYVAIDDDGRARSNGGVVFDEARNWTFVRALVTDPRVRVNAVFVARWIRERLLRYGARIGDLAAVRRAADVLLQPSDAPPHDDHFHVRISCPAKMDGCIELPKRRVK